MASDTTESTYKVYCYTNKVNNKKYIGITKRSLEERSNRTYGYQGSTKFYNAIKKYGWNSFVPIILETNLTKEDACKKEIYYIELYKTRDSHYGYNISIGGDCTALTPEIRKKISVALTGKHLSAETRKKLSIAHKNKPSPRKGHKYTEEERLKSSLAHKGIGLGRVMSEETKEKIRKAHLGKKMKKTLVRENENTRVTGKPKRVSFSKEHRENLSKSHNPRKLKCVETGEIATVKEFVQKYNLINTNLYRCADGERKTTGKLHWEWVNNND